MSLCWSSACGGPSPMVLRILWFGDPCLRDSEAVIISLLFTSSTCQRVPSLSVGLPAHGNKAELWLWLLLSPPLPLVSCGRWCSGAGLSPSPPPGPSVDWRERARADPSRSRLCRPGTGSSENRGVQCWGLREGKVSHEKPGAARKKDTEEGRGRGRWKG